MGQYLFNVLEYRTSTYRSRGVFICVNLTVLLPNLMRMALAVLVLSLLLDFISSRVMVKRYFCVTCWSYYYVLIIYYKWGN
jgi:hypothetical protein